MSAITSFPRQLGARIDDYAVSCRWLRVSRMRAFAGHLCLSMTIVGIVFAVVFFIWYPQPYFTAAGAWSVIRVLIGVDLVLGPLLTLIVFRPGKRLLLLDVAIIAFVQLSALIYGLTALYTQRPYYAVFALDRFHVLTREDIVADADDMQEWMRKPLVGPLLASARIPQDVAAQQRLLEETVFGNQPDIEQRPEFWVPLTDDLQALRERALPMSALRDVGEREAQLADRIVARFTGPSTELGFFPIISPKHDAVAIVDVTTGNLLDVAEIDPWVVLAGRRD